VADLELVGDEAEPAFLSRLVDLDYRPAQNESPVIALGLNRLLIALILAREG